ncbi:hypothetical protein HHK36_023109 [Tetracentron sinense]|uniref:Kinesin motor domain-containing protein n=1 Tax=Tetracentron sinense TaxID=13715 RepID=A0A834YPN8_TETSI|nr:hypothetical protein HHK36_023109 [Tetracentron sinense]
MMESNYWERQQEMEDRKKIVQDLQNGRVENSLHIFEEEMLRKKLSNTIMDLKGNIRVFCRVRPLVLDDSTKMPSTSYPISIEARGRGVDLSYNGQNKSYMFDHVFTHEASQQEIFVEIEELVQSALDGYKVCIFAYGQTGSGKTYTMMGRSNDLEHKGLIPRSLEHIFQTGQSLLPHGWVYTIKVSILEIYNDKIRDLLSMDRLVGGKKFLIQHIPKGNTTVSDLTIVEVHSVEEASSLLHKATQRRSVGRTQMNQHSSRSHFVFTLRISGVHETTKKQVDGILNLIDLAGNERLSKSKSTGDQRKETTEINSSLLCLSNVITALSRKCGHVPFRDSKLTYLLQPCLAGDSKTLMFVNISSDPSSASESFTSLEFARNVNACGIGIPQRQTKMLPSDSP